VHLSHPNSRSIEVIDPGHGPKNKEPTDAKETEHRLQLFDFDANLLHPDFENKILDIVSNAQLHDVVFFGVPSSSMKESELVLHLESLNLTSLLSKIYVAVGIHPYNAGMISRRDFYSSYLSFA